LVQAKASNDAVIADLRRQLQEARADVTLSMRAPMKEITNGM
jgi:hypothetical protein